MNLVRRQLLSLAGACFTLVVAAAWAFANGPANEQTDFPSRRIRLVLPYSAGGLVDVATRIVTDKLSEMWHQPIVIEAKPAVARRFRRGRGAEPVLSPDWANPTG